jgi:hypothetical protein
MALPNDKVRCMVRVAATVAGPSGTPSAKRKLVIVDWMMRPNE